MTNILGGKDIGQALRFTHAGWGLPQGGWKRDPGSSGCPRIVSGSPGRKGQNEPKHALSHRDGQWKPFAPQTRRIDQRPQANAR